MIRTKSNSLITYKDNGDIVGAGRGALLHRDCLAMFSTGLPRHELFNFLLECSILNGKALPHQIIRANGNAYGDGSGDGGGHSLRIEKGIGRCLNTVFLIKPTEITIEMVIESAHL